MRAGVIEALRQVWEGDDIPPPESLLRNVTAETATKKLPWMPYSIITNVEHADFWNRVWLNRLKGQRAESFVKDWRVPPADEWVEIRRRLLANYREAMRIAAADPFEHQMKSDEVAWRMLMNIAVHTSYHLGQVNLLKRGLRLEGKTRVVGCSEDLT